MGGSRTEVLLLLLTGIVLLLMVAIIGLFLRMNQLQREVLAALEPLRPAQPPAGLSPGTQAPAFTLPDLSGRSVSLEALAGRRVLLAFASPHCPACREMYPHLRAFAEAHPEVAVVMISLGTGEENRAVAEAYGLAFPVYGCGYGTCGSDWRTVPELGYRFCCYQVCNGCPGSCCWYTGQWGCFCPHCSP